MAVGGAPISQMFADEIGADGYGQNASAAVDLFLRPARSSPEPWPTYKILYWQEIPSQIKAEDERRRHAAARSEVHGAHRSTGRRARAAGTDDYLAQWHWSDEQEREAPPQKSPQADRSSSSKPPPTGRARHAMPVTLTVNGHQSTRPLGVVALRRAPSRPACACPRPASPRASARSASSKSRAGWSSSRRRPSSRSTSTARQPFRLSCQCRVVADDGEIDVPHDAARPDAHRAARAAPAGHARTTTARSGRHARRRSHRRHIDGDEIDRSDGPDSRPRDGSRHHDDRPAAGQSRNRRARRRRVVRESAALRRLRRDVAHPLRHRASRQAADAHARRLPHPRHRGVSRRSAIDLRDGRRRQLDDARSVLPAERVFDRPEPVPLDHRDRDGGGQARPRPA